MGFPSDERQPCEPAQRAEALRAAKGQSVGIEIGGWHDFRHSLTTSLRRQGTHPKIISGILGHSDTQLAMRVYDHLEVEEFRLPLDQMLRSVTNLEASV